MPSLSASAELPCRNGRRSEEPPSKRRLHRRRHRRRSKRRQKAFWLVWSNRNVGRLFLPNGWNVPALHYPDRTSRNGIRKSAWHENNVSVKKLKRDVKMGNGASPNEQGCFEKSFPLDHAKISKREIDVRGEIYELV